MASREELKRITRKRLQTTHILIEAGDWEMSAYMMGYALECTLKAAACKTLKLITYPPLNKKKEDQYFKTHQFEQLLIVSGLSDIFSPTGLIKPYQHWSDFTLEYPGEWPQQRYNEGMQKRFDEPKIRDLYNGLYEDNESIIKTIARRRRW